MTLEFLLGGSPEEEADQIRAHLLEDRCVPCLFLAREALAEAEPELRENLRRWAYRDRYSENERSAGFASAMRQVERRQTIVAAERLLAPESWKR